MKMFNAIRRLSIGFALAAAVTPASSLAAVVPIYTFQGDSNGNRPGQIVFGKDGSIYGVTFLGGADNDGTVFRLDPPAHGNKWKLTTLHSFSGGSDGAHPVGIVFGDDGKLYGATNNGGGTHDLCQDGCGTVFRLNLRNKKETIIRRFAGRNGKFPVAEPVVHNGSLYVTASFGGRGYGGGTVSRLDPPDNGKTWKQTVLHNFTDATSYNLLAPVTFVGDDIFGTTYNGGSDGVGTVFKLSPSKPGKRRWRYEVLVYLQYTMWAGPQAPLIYRKGALYGTATTGGLGYGVVSGLGLNSGEDDPILYRFKGAATATGR